MWKATITNKSSINAAGLIEVTVDIYDGKSGDLLVAPGVVIVGTPAEINNRITEKMQDLCTAYEQAQTINVGDEITL